MLRLVKNRSQIDMDQFCCAYEETLSQDGASPERYFSERDRLYWYLREVFFNDPEAFCGLWEIQGRCVSILRMERYRDGFHVSGLETSPDARGRGFAKSLIRAVIDSMMESYGSVTIYSHIKKNNFRSIQVHLSCGFIKITDSARLLDGSFSSEYCTFLYKK